MMKSQDDDTVNTLKYYAGIDLGGTGIKCGIVNENGKIIAIKKMSYAKRCRSKRDYFGYGESRKRFAERNGINSRRPA